MNISFKHLLFSTVLVSLFANTNIHCMLVKKLAKTSAFYSLGQKSITNTINPKELKPELTHVGTRLYKLESDTRDTQKQLDTTEKSLEKMQEFSYATRSDMLTLQKRVEKLESKIETLESQVLLCSLKKFKKQSGIKIFGKPATKEEIKKHCNGSRAEPFDEEVIYWEPMTPEMIEKFRQSLAGTLEDYERRKRDGGGVY